MSVDQKEVSAFKAALSRTLTKVIVKKLEENVIARSWKRELAEEEVARRNKAESSRAVEEADQKYRRHFSAMWKGWGIAILLIVGAVAAAFVVLVNG
ncbi:MAG: hypothetical protein HQL36_07640 [Alphaproteobacteria bacterium]|nr:hypothetical protein [Alphaproteobacteria bacterium]